MSNYAPTPLKRILLVSMAAMIMALFGTPLTNFAEAAQLSGRSLSLSNSSGGATGVSYTFASAALPTSGTAVKSLKVQFCTAASGACTTPSGFSSSASTLSSQPTGLGAGSGWTANTSSSGELRILNAANATTPSGVVSVPWGGVVNPTANNTTFYGIITTYSDAAWATPLDSGVVAVSTSQQIQVNLSVLETLTFCTGTAITGQNCGTVTGSTVSLGNASISSTNSGTSVMAAATNATTGYTIAVYGTTLTSGGNTITALASQTASSVGSSQFGINLKANTTPSVGANVTGTGSATATANYATADSFRYVSGDSIASVGAPTNGNTFTVSYMANIAGTTAPGTYTTNLTYVATGTF